MTAAGGAARSGPADDGERLDIFVSNHAGISRTKAQKLIHEGYISVGGVLAKKNHLMSSGEDVSWEVPRPEPEEIIPQDLPLEIVFEDPHILVIDKASDMVMYPGPGHGTGTLLNALLARYPDLAGVGGKGRPGVFHRLDKGTSGLVSVARTEEAYYAMVDKIQARDVRRVYVALVVGPMPAQMGTIDAPMGRSRTNRKRMAVDLYAGRPAVSNFEVLERFSDEFTLVEVTLETGRTHQIRVHFAHIGHPVAGDPEYSRGKAGRQLGLDRQFLHAHKLEFAHPVSGEDLSFTSTLPADLQGVLDALRDR
ncbi:MAG: RluA family pseudouridine synthase [Candidatus Geothermincolia bacterium]